MLRTPSELEHDPVGHHFWADVALERGEGTIAGTEGTRAALGVERTGHTGEIGLQIGVGERAHVCPSRQETQVAKQRCQRSQAYREVIALAAPAATRPDEVACRAEPQCWIRGAGSLLQ